MKSRMNHATRQINSAQKDWEMSKKESTSASASVLNEMQLQNVKGDMSKVSAEERLPPEKSKGKPKPLAILEELTLNINNNEDIAQAVPIRRRTNSLQRSSEHSTRNSLSVQSEDEKNRRRYSSASYNTNVNGSTNLAESRASHISSSRGKFSN